MPSIKYSLTYILIFIVTSFYGQTVTLEITKTNGFEDAFIYKNLKPGYEDRVDTNYEIFPRITSTAWTHSGYKTYWPSLFRFKPNTKWSTYAILRPLRLEYLLAKTELLGTVAGNL